MQRNILKIQIRHNSSSKRERKREYLCQFASTTPKLRKTKSQKEEREIVYTKLLLRH